MKITRIRSVLRHGLVFLLWIGLCAPITLLRAQNATDVDMVFVPGGTFTMGCTYEQTGDCAFDENPSHTVTLTGFAIAKYEVTQALWKQVMGSNPSRYMGDDLPVQNVSWDDVQLFIQRLNQMTGKTYRLPTEAEWEYAARGGATPPSQYRFSGAAEPDKVCWYADNSESQPHAVGSKQPNSLGLYDMSGNVWEWCSDLYGTYSDKAQKNPTGADKGMVRVVRGGCYAAMPKMCRVSTRKSLYQGGKDFATGFRLAMDDDREARAEEARVAAEKAAAEAAKKAEQDRIAAEKAAEQERIAVEKAAAEAARKAEQDRIAAEKAAADAARKAEQERIAAEKAAEQARIAAEKAEEKAIKQAETKARLDEIPSTVFFTVNADVWSYPQWAVGFKVGTMKNLGWFVGFMTNFNYAGMFRPFEEEAHYVLTGKSRTSYMELSAGITVRRYKMATFLCGLGFAYRSYNLQTDKGWYRYNRDNYLGPLLTAGVLLHFGKFALSLEGHGLYNIDMKNPNGKFAFGGNLGLGFCIPYQNEKQK